jgi:hypothetical protein
MFHCIVITRFSSLRSRMVSKVYHNPLTIDPFVVRTLRQTIRAKMYLSAFVNKTSKTASSPRFKLCRVTDMQKRSGGNRLWVAPHECPDLGIIPNLTARCRPKTRVVIVSESDSPATWLTATSLSSDSSVRRCGPEC